MNGFFFHLIPVVCHFLDAKSSQKLWHSDCIIIRMATQPRNMRSLWHRFNSMRINKYSEADINFSKCILQSWNGLERDAVPASWCKQDGIHAMWKVFSNGFSITINFNRFKWRGQIKYGAFWSFFRTFLCFFYLFTIIKIVYSVFSLLLFVMAKLNSRNRNWSI